MKRETRRVIMASIAKKERLGTAAIDVKGLSKHFGVGDGKVVALNTISVVIRENEFFTLLGPSGCGKTTLLRMIAGFDFPSEGRLLLHGEDIAALPPNHRPINTVFQNYALFPHMTVAENIAFGLEMLDQPKAKVAARVTEMLTPGTTVNDKLLEHNSNNFLAAIHFADASAQHDQYGLAFLDISTGEFFIAEGDREYADKLLQGFKPAEVIFQRHLQKKFKEIFGGKMYTYTLDEWIFDNRYAEDILLNHFPKR